MSTVKACYKKCGGGAGVISESTIVANKYKDYFGIRKGFAVAVCFNRVVNQPEGPGVERYTDTERNRF